MVAPFLIFMVIKSKPMVLMHLKLKHPGVSHWPSSWGQAGWSRAGTRDWWVFQWELPTYRPSQPSSLINPRLACVRVRRESWSSLLSLDMEPAEALLRFPETLSLSSRFAPSKIFFVLLILLYWLLLFHILGWAGEDWEEGRTVDLFLNLTHNLWCLVILTFIFIHLPPAGIFHSLILGICNTFSLISPGCTIHSCQLW